MGVLKERIYWIEKVDGTVKKESLWDGVGIVIRRKGSLLYEVGIEVKEGGGVLLDYSWPGDGSWHGTDGAMVFSLYKKKRGGFLGRHALETLLPPVQI